jgi:predicted dehydrogenase
LCQIATFLATVRKRCPEKLAAAYPQYQDYRSMLGKEKLDAVFVATTVHARTLACHRPTTVG